jgi:tetratricopeptide (TPR) repeat protein
MRRHCADRSGGYRARPTMFPRSTAFLTLALLLAATGCHRRHTVSKNPDLITPALAARALEAKTLFYNGMASPWVAKERPELAQPARAAAFAQAVQDPKLFRKLDRESRFDAIWLCGDPSQFKPLLEHLLETPDFTLAYLDQTSLVFRRGGGTWDIAQLDTLRANFSAPGEQAAFLAGAATRLLGIRRLEDAKRCLEQAQKLDSSSPDVWSGWSTWRMLRGEMPAAVEAADKALALDPDSLPALACKTQALYASKQFSPAFDLSERLVALSPDEPGALFYHAKISHEAHAYYAEIRTLEHLIDLATSSGADVSGYRIYLGQAFAAKGDAESAMDQLSRALVDPELPREQRKFCDNLFNQIKERAAP